MKKFIIFFQGKEGTSPLVHFLNSFDNVSIVHQVDNRGFEPFDRYFCGLLPTADLERCLDMIFSDGAPNMDRLNRIYTRTAKRPLETIEAGEAVGFKMRFVPPRRELALAERIPLLRGYYYPRWRERQDALFKVMMFRLLRRHDVTAFFSFRQDVLRWALSRYHGDGTGKSGHLQFRLADGSIRKEDIPKITVDCDVLEERISNCEAALRRRTALVEEMRGAGIKAHSILYEEFCRDKRMFFKDFFAKLDMLVSDGEIEEALAKGDYYKKVHSDDISEFVTNHREVLARFAGRYVALKQ